MHPTSTPRKRLTTATALAAGALLALPASGMAAQSFGSGLGHAPANGPMECVALPAPCSFVAYLQSGNGDGMKPRPAPSDGVVVKFRIRSSTPDVVTFRLADISVAGETATATGRGVGPTVTLAGTEEIEEFPARVAVTKGAHVALDGTSHGATYDSSGGEDTYLFAPPLSPGQSLASTESSGGELLVQAVMEPDSDKDGFGDETQDSCPTDAGTQQGACPQPDTVKPKLTGVSLAPKAFKGSTKLLYRLSETANVTVKVENAKKGRKVRGKCRKQTAANEARKRCTRYVKLRGSVKATGGAGLNELTLNARMGGRKLGPGKYRAVVVARDLAGNVSATKRIGFRVKK